MAGRPRSLRVTMIIGRFAPSPTGPLHQGSLVAAVGSWLYARAAGGRWLVRMEDLDTPRVIPGSADEILAALRLYGLEWDGAVLWQSARLSAYEQSIIRLREAGLAYDCACSRSDLQRASSAPASGDPTDALVYPGTCRRGLPGRAPRAVRFVAPVEEIAFVDAVCGPHAESVAASTGDFVVRRADGLFAYQLAVVVDDAAQGVNQVVRGADLLASTARQIALQRALGFPQPEYAHLPLVTGSDGAKISKRDGALPLPALDRKVVLDSLRRALMFLGLPEVSGETSAAMLASAVKQFAAARTR